MRDSQKLIIKIKKLFPNINIPDNIEIKRTYAGYWQKSRGAFTSVYEANGFFIFGIFEPVKKLLKCPNLHMETYQGDRIIECNCIGNCKGKNKD